MLVEWEVTLDCNYKCEYCVNSRNSALPTPIPYEHDKEKVFKFIEELKEKYPDEELFLFGGEPLLHNFLNEIIVKLNQVQLDFVIQTNFSMPHRIQDLEGDFILQVSVHPTQIRNKAEYIQGIEKYQDLIRRVDVMYYGKESIEYYKEIAKIYPREKLFLVPVAGFKGCTDSNKYLYEYNEMRQGIMSKVLNFEEGNRSFIWEEQMKGLWSPKNKPCMYKDTYVLFDPMLRQFSCSYRESNDICTNDHCFLM